ncbi:MAG: GDSL-type esterase/lipase family protein [Acidobacteriota bacterium]
MLRWSLCLWLAPALLGAAPNDERSEIQNAIPLRGGAYVLAETERGVSLLRQTPNGLRALWDRPGADYVVLAGSTALFKIRRAGGEAIEEADISDVSARPAFHDVAAFDSIGGLSATESGGALHMAITAVEDGHERVYYICREAGAWSRPVLLSPAGINEPRTMPAISVSEGRILVAYSGYDGEDYEIYAVTGLAGSPPRFAPERAVTHDSGAADILPSIRQDESGGRLLCWVHNDGTGRRAMETPLLADGTIVEPVAEPPRTRPAAAAAVNSFCGFGDSITEGNTPEDHSQSTRVGYYPTLIDLLSQGYGPTQVFNEGFGGEITAEGLARLPGVLSSIRPAYVLLMEGTNDVTRHSAITPATTRDNLRAMTQKCVGAGTTALLSTLLPRGRDDDFDPTGYHTRATNELIRKLIIDDRLGYVDIYNAFIADPNYAYTLMTDKVHPNARGFQLMGQKWWGLIKTLAPRAPESLSSEQVGTKKKAKLTWPPNAESDRAGYILQYGTRPNVYDRTVDLGNKTAYWVTDLQYDTTYYFRLRCYDSVQNLSDLSPESSVTIIK